MKKGKTPIKAEQNNGTKSKFCSNESNIFVQKKAKKAKVRVHYSSESLNEALKAIESGISVRKAEREFGVPRNTLTKIINNYRSPKVLSVAEEEEIVNWIMYCAERGYPVTKTEVFNAVQKYLQSIKKVITRFVENRPGGHWYHDFKRKHPKLIIRKEEKHPQVAVTKDNLSEWFSEHKQYLKKNNLLNISPNRIYNYVETNINLNPDLNDARKIEQRCVVLVHNALGIRSPPLLMLPNSEIKSIQLLKNIPENWGIGISKNGKMTCETFYEYIANMFYPWLLSERVEFPVIIYLDKHSSHTSIPLIPLCRERKIELIELHPNTSHIIQPFDVAFFQPFTVAWNNAVVKWKTENCVLELTMKDFPAVLKLCLDSMENEKTIVQNGFKASGLYPFNFDAVNCDVLDKKTKKSKSTKKLVTSPDNDYKKHLRQFKNNIAPEL